MKNPLQVSVKCIGLSNFNWGYRLRKMIQYDYIDMGNLATFFN
jgi:hypothetical protein